MRACSSASGGVIFVPEEIEREIRSTRYSKFVEQENATEKVGVFGKKKKASGDESSDSRVA